jgi:enoyl-CoA hydratase/carnithine racemase
MAPEAVRYETMGSAARLTIDREERRNTLSDEVVDGILDGLGRAAGDTDVRCVVLTGAGDRAFCAGGDLAGNLAPDQGRASSHDRGDRVATLLRTLAEHPQPVVARVNGVALAGGFGLMLGCDLAVAADDVQVGTPEINLGLWPYLISAVIARNVPRKIAMEMMLTGRRWSAAEAERWGMVNRTAPRAELDTAVDELVEELASKSPLILRLGKESFHRAQDMSFDDALAYLGSMLTRNLETEDVAEGVSAFFARRKPEWKGR